MANLCNCGALTQRKVGTVMRDGREYCRKCELPTTFDASIPIPLRSTVSRSRMTTLQLVPGYRTTSVHGVVSVLTSASGFTASAKGNDALRAAMNSLGLSAAELGANAVIGLVASAFGAAGGITSAFGGDAVGILLMGTAVSVEPDAAPAL